MNENLKHAVNTLRSTDDWFLAGCGDDWAVMTYIHAGPDDARTIRLEVTEPATTCRDPDCIAQGCPEHPLHNNGDHTYEQHHNRRDHVGRGPCRCSYR